MTKISLTTTLHKIADDICFLADYAHCPPSQRKLLRFWSGQVRRGAQTAFQEDILFGVVGALVTLSHSCAAFSRPVAPPFCRAAPKLDISDQGGYFAARQAITELIRSAPINDNLRLLLAQHALRRIDCDMRQMESLVPIS
jgi:hypothetical protein